MPDAGTDRVDPAALRPGLALANAYGHEVGIAEYVLGAMIALSRSFGRLRLMKPTAYLVNVARAEILDEEALYPALAEGRIAGAALDVWYRYPISDAPTLPATRPFHTLGNVIMTPHVSGWTEGMLASRAALIADNIAHVGRGEAAVNAIDSSF